MELPQVDCKNHGFAWAWAANRKMVEFARAWAANGNTVEFVVNVVLLSRKRTPSFSLVV